LRLVNPDETSRASCPTGTVNATRSWTGCDVPCCRRYWRSSRRARSRSSPRSLPPELRRAYSPGPSGTQSPVRRVFAIGRRPWARRYNSPPPHRNWRAHENAVASVATVGNDTNW